MSGALKSLLALKKQAQIFGAPSVRSFAAETLPQFSKSLVRDPATGLLAPQWHYGSFGVAPGNSRPRPGMHFGTHKAAQERDIGAPLEYLDRELTREVVDEFGWDWKDPRTGEEVKRRMDHIMDSDPAAALEGYRPDPGSVKTSPYLLDIRKPLIVEDAGGDNDKWNYLLRLAREQDRDGLLYKNKVEDKGSNSWVTLGDRPQVKSLRARTLDMGDADVYKAGGGLVKGVKSLRTALSRGYATSDEVTTYPGKAHSDRISEVQLVPLNQLRAVDDIQQHRLLRIRDALQKGVPLPAIIAEFSAETADGIDVMDVVDGAHRLKALQELGVEFAPVRAVVSQDDWPAIKRSGGLKIRGAVPYAGGGLVRGLKAVRKGLAAADPEALTPAARLKDADEQLRLLPEVIKKPGGNWFTGSVERAVKPLKTADPEGQKRILRRHNRGLDPAVMADLESDLDAEIALNRWIDKKLAPYIKNDMATERDPIRALAERGVTPVAQLRPLPRREVSAHRDPWEGAGRYGKSPDAIRWEDVADFWVRPMSLDDVRELPGGGVHAMPFDNLAGDTPIYSLANWNPGLGFDHIVDVLREQLTTGALTPQQLDKVNITNAVERTHAYNLEREAARKAALAANLESMTPYKAYDEGWRWVQLDKPGQFAAESDAMGHSVRGYEPPRGHKDWTKESGNSGSPHYGLGGWDAITSGRAKIYSLKDSKGKTYATVEASENPWWEEQGFEDTILNDRSALREAYSDIWREVNPTEENLRNFPQLLKERFPDVYEAHGHKFPERILKVRQLKGPGNGKPDPAALPYIQDFVRSGNWSEVRDLQNARMQSLGGKHYSEDDLRGIYERAMKSLTPEQRADETIPPFEDLGWSYYPLKAERADDITQDTPFDSAIMRELGLKP